MAERVAHAVARDRSDDTEADHGSNLQVATGAEEASGEQQAVTRKEEPDEQTRLGHGDEKHESNGRNKGHTNGRCSVDADKNELSIAAVLPGIVLQSVVDEPE